MELFEIKFNEDGGKVLSGEQPDSDVLTLMAGRKAEFTTSSSVLDAQTLIEKTTIRYATLRLFFDGKARVQVVRHVGLGENAKKHKFVSCVLEDFDAENGARCMIDLLGGGLISFTIMAIDDITVYGGNWSVSDDCGGFSPRVGVILDVPENSRKDVIKELAPFRENYSLDIYYPKKRMTSDDVLIDVVDEVVDTQPQPDEPNVVPSSEYEGEGLECIGLGQSGFLACGLLKCATANKTHFLYVGTPHVTAKAVKRMFTLVSVLRPEHRHCGFIGAEIRGDELVSNGKNLRGAELCNDKEHLSLMTIGGLWQSVDKRLANCADSLFIAPLVATKSVGYPLPVYCNVGVAEFCKRVNDFAPLVATLGINVEYDACVRGDYEYYYDVLASFASYAVNGGRWGFPLRRRLSKLYRKNRGKNRERLDYVYDAVDDFLRGPNFLATVNGAKLHSHVSSSPRKRRHAMGSFFKYLGLWFRLFFVGGRCGEFLTYAFELTSPANWKIRLGVEM